MSSAITVFLFVKDVAQNTIEDLVSQAQCAAALDTIGKLTTIPEIGQVIVATASGNFAVHAAALGAQVEIDPPGVDFHWGKRIAGLVEKYRAEIPLYIGGGSGVLMSTDDWRNIAQRAQRETNSIIANNFYSCDFAAWSPGDALTHIELPSLDNDLAFRLGEHAHLAVSVLPKNAATQFDIDTPTDLTILSLCPSIGNYLRTFLDHAKLDPSRAEQIQSLLKNRDATLLIAGRVSAAMALFLERATRCQWRILSEERGMRASGRDERGQVRSLLGLYVDQVGAQEFVATLPQLADAALIDSRVLFAHWQLHPTPSDRFNSDLIQTESIHDPLLRGFTAAIRDAHIPILLGGHSLVAAGMYALVEMM